MSNVLRRYRNLNEWATFYHSSIRQLPKCTTSHGFLHSE
jgi:hypothetical protein